jgi:hypothetical protein
MFIFLHLLCLLLIPYSLLLFVIMSDYTRVAVNVLPEFTRYAFIHEFAEYCIVPFLNQKRIQSLSIGDRIDLPEK